MNNAELLQLRESVIAIAEQAAREIFAIYQSGFEVQIKDDHSPVTKADSIAHDVIAQGLQRLTPELPILSEESALLDWSARKQWSRYWLVDPLDGTREFVKRNGEFCVNIALIEQHRPIVAVVWAPVGDRCWHAVLGSGAFLRQHKQDLRLLIQTPLPRPWRVALSRSHLDAKTVALVDRLGEVIKVNLGSSLKFCQMAEGCLDIYPRFGPTSEWDTAAGQCILEAAGGSVITLDGQALAYNTKESILNPDFLALGDAQLDWRQWLD